MPYTVISHLASPTSDAFDFSSLDLSGYADVQLALNGLVVGTDDADILLRVDIGGSLISAGYHVAGQTESSGGSAEENVSTSQTSISLNDQSANWGIGNAAGESFCGMIFIKNASISVAKLIPSFVTRVAPSGNSVIEITAGMLNNTGTLDGIHITTSTGTLTAGTATLFGIATA